MSSFLSILFSSPRIRFRTTDNDRSSASMSNNTYGTCPVGGNWYTCTAQTPTFFGCCLSNPCNGFGCPTDDLLPAGMGVGTGNDPGIANDTSYWPNVNCAHGKWYTCADQTPSFQGCCISDPCSGDGGTCPAGNLFPAAFGGDLAGNSTSTVSVIAMSASSAPLSIFSTQRANTISAAPTRASSTLPTSTVLAVSASITSATLASSTSPTQLPSSSVAPRSNAGVIAGAAAGGTVAFVSILLLVAFFTRKCWRTRVVATDTVMRVDPFACIGAEASKSGLDDMWKSAVLDMMSLYLSNPTTFLVQVPLRISLQTGLQIPIFVSLKLIQWMCTKLEVAK